jgi:hypothetical protein
MLVRRKPLSASEALKIAERFRGLIKPDDPVSDLALDLAESFLLAAMPEIKELYAAKHGPPEGEPGHPRLFLSIGKEATDAEMVRANCFDYYDQTREPQPEFDDLRHVLPKVASKLRRQEIRYDVVGGFLSRIEEAALRQLGVTSYEDLIEKYFAQAKEQISNDPKCKEEYQRYQQQHYTEEEFFRSEAQRQLGRIVWDSMDEVEREVFGEQIEAAVAQRMAEGEGRRSNHELS